MCIKSGSVRARKDGKSSRTQSSPQALWFPPRVWGAAGLRVIEELDEGGLWQLRCVGTCVLFLVALSMACLGSCWHLA